MRVQSFILLQLEKPLTPSAPQLLRTIRSFCNYRPALAHQGFTSGAAGATQTTETSLGRRESKNPYQHVEDVEPLEYYCSGGYHPVCIGDKFQDRYRVVHKLGYGTFSTTWLALDEQERVYVAIKIAVSRISSSREGDILQLLRHTDDKSIIEPGREIIPPILDRFVLEGPNGSHKCLVTVPAMMSVAEGREASYKRVFQLPVARAIATQLIQAVAFLHSRGVVHSDLHERNILLSLSMSISHLEPEQLYREFDEPELVLVQRIDGVPLERGVPLHAVVPIWMGKGCEDVVLPESRIFLTDFGESFQPSTQTVYKSHTPLILRSPEQYFTHETSLSFPSDVWALACAMFSVLGQRTLFESWFPTEDALMAEQVDALGLPPYEWWNSWKNRDQFFNGKVERTDRALRRTLEVKLEYSIQEARRDLGMAGMGQEERNAFLALLRSMLVFEPEKRISASEVLESEWVQRWGMQDVPTSLSIGSQP